MGKALEARVEAARAEDARERAMRQIASIPREVREAIMNAGRGGPPHIPTNIPRDEREAIAARHGYDIDDRGELVPAGPPVVEAKEPTLEEARADWLARYGCYCTACADAFREGGVVAADAALAFEGEVGNIVATIAAGCRADRYGDTSGEAHQAERLAIEVVRHSHVRRAAIRQLFDVAPDVKPGIGAKGARTGGRE